MGRDLDSTEPRRRRLISPGIVAGLITVLLADASTISIAHAGDLARSNVAYARQDYVGAAKALSHAARARKPTSARPAWLHVRKWPRCSTGL